ncbi:GlsB/YeaQ/YmgE family stress response membrane protein [Candidatus Roizmanbacteria bacterium]|nr:GlsB/YeaQ/YmgE family stress response membrane protein [Candidatus Roizmanbacteria bacterium]
MNIILWIILGLLAGWIASIIMKTDSRQGPITDIILGIIGAFLGGFIVSLFGGSGVNGFNLYSLFISVLGAIIVIWIGRKLWH